MLLRLVVIFFSASVLSYGNFASAKQSGSKNIAPLKKSGTTKVITTKKTSTTSPKETPPPKKTLPTSKTTTTSKTGESFYASNTRSVVVKGDHNLYYGKVGEKTHNHAVIDSKGTPRYIREGGKVIVEDTRIVGRGFVNGAEIAVRSAPKFVAPEVYIPPQVYKFLPPNPYIPPQPQAH